MLYMIINPTSKSGKGIKIWEQLENELKQNAMEYQTYFTTKEGGAKAAIKDILQSASLESLQKQEDLICVLGGDGTVNQTVSALRGYGHKDLPIAYLPTGSSNDLAKSLQLSSDPEEFLSHIKAMSLQCADTGLLTIPNGKKRAFCVSCGIGIDAAVCKEALDSNLKKVLNRIGLGKLTYAFIALKQLINAPVSGCDLILDDGVLRHFDRFLFGVTMVQPYEGGGIKMAPMADCHDGEFDILIVANMKKWRVLYLLPLAFFGLHTKAKNIYFYRSTSVRIKTDAPLTVHTDGEFAGMRTEISLECKKADLKYI